MLNKIWEWIKNLIRWFHTVKEEEVPETPYLVSTISMQEVKLLLKKICDVNHIYLSDWKYGLTSPALAKKFTRQSKIQFKQYIPEGRDCDELSLALYYYWNEPLENFAMGICWSDTHAFCFMLDHNHNIWFIEPSTNEWFTLEQIKKTNKYWPIRMCLL